MRSSDIAAYAGLEQALLGPMLRSLRGRNSALDALFYDVTSLTAAETLLLGADTNPEGSVLLVHPAGSADSGIERFRTVSGYVAQAAGRAQAIAVAGVGSSALGTAALARNVADALGEPVAAVVSGYGMADAIGEAVGGWFGFGAANAARQAVDRTLDRVAPWLSALDETPGRGRPTAATGSDRVRGDADSEALAGLLGDPALDIRLLVGHSKGCLSIASALFALHDTMPEHFAVIAPRLAVATFGAVVHLPDGLMRTQQFLGDLDWFGGINSRRGEAHVSVPSAWHHLNTRLPAHLSITAELRKALPLLRTPAPPPPERPLALGAPAPAFPDLPVVAGADPL